jgi:hypothetical protein
VRALRVPAGQGVIEPGVRGRREERGKRQDRGGGRVEKSE